MRVQDRAIYSGGLHWMEDERPDGKDLEQATPDAARSIARADGELPKELVRIERESTDMTVEESVERLKAATGRCTPT